jgi:plasmid stabilization system protein ParE
MARLELLPNVFEDFNRFSAHLAEFAVSDIPERIKDIIQALQVLTRRPLIGRPLKSGNRELVIGKGSKGYVALYRFEETIDTVFVLAIRNQREMGYKLP